jgi:hypothetical protein
VGWDLGVLMKPSTYVACGACGKQRGVAAAECPRYDCPWLSNQRYREFSACKLGEMADRLFLKYVRGVDEAYARAHEFIP